MSVAAVVRSSLVSMPLCLTPIALASADNVHDVDDHPNPAYSAQASRSRVAVLVCGEIRDRMTERLMAQRDKVFHYGYDFNAKDGYIKNTPLNLYMRYARDEISLANEEFQRAFHEPNLTVGQCEILANKYSSRLDCLYDKATKNDARGMEACSSTYMQYDDPYRYYGGKPVR